MSEIYKYFRNRALTYEDLLIEYEAYLEPDLESEPAYYLDDEDADDDLASLFACIDAACGEGETDTLAGPVKTAADIILHEQDGCGDEDA
jgi:hypothetical protein